MLARYEFNILIDLVYLCLVKIDSLDGCVPDTEPVGILKPGPCRQRNILELCKVRLEAI
jgi:hypothetical protein